jgi:hypothetical protein
VLLLLQNLNLLPLLFRVQKALKGQSCPAGKDCHCLRQQQQWRLRPWVKPCRPVLLLLSVLSCLVLRSQPQRCLLLVLQPLLSLGCQRRPCRRRQPWLRPPLLPWLLTPH